MADRGSSLASRLERWLAEARVDEAARQRSRERWLREVAEQEATLGGVLADLAERRAGVSLTAAGRRHHGLIEVIGVDFVALRSGSGDVLLATRALGVVRAAPSVAGSLGDRVLATELRLSEVLHELAAERERVLVATVDGETVAGVLRSVGHDVLVLQADGDPPAPVYVPLASIGEVAIR